MDPMQKAPIPRWRVVLASVVGLGLFGGACSVLLDRSEQQCSVDTDCVKFGGRPHCQAGVCVASSLGPDGCFFGTPTTNDDFLNQCSTSKCETFDNCARLGLCASGAQPPPALAPPGLDAGPPVDAPPPPTLPPCIVAGKNTVVVTGSTALQPFLGVVASVLAGNSPPYQVAYQSSGSCNGVENIFNADSNRRLVKDVPNRTNLLFEANKTPVACSFGTVGVPVDVGISDVFAKSCNPAYLPNDRIAEYVGPVQPMTFTVPATSAETAMSAELGRFMFGRGGQDPGAAPFTDPLLYSVRNSSSGTQQMMARAIGVNAAQWWGVDRGGSTRVRDSLLAVAPARANGAIGILSTDFADAERARLRILAFKDKNQLCAYYPDSSQFTRDKLNVRDGHYSIWGPVHLYAAITDGLPNPAAAALVTRFTVARLDLPLLDSIIKSGLVPQCAMKVQRTDEMGPLSAYSPPFQCGCYFEATVPSGAAPAECKTCNGPADCPAGKPACNLGYCEEK